jgi:hypothetical protein
MTGDITMAETTNDIPGANPSAVPAEGSGIAPASAFSTSGAPVQIVPDVDPSHPAVDNDPRANTTAEMNKIDFNDPRPRQVIEAEAAAKATSKA